MGLVLLMLYMGGVFRTGTLGPATPVPAGLAAPPPARTWTASKRTITEYYEAVGTVRPRTEATIESQVTGRIVEVTVRPGDPVTKGRLLIVLDAREFQARLDQARQGIASAQARKEQARQAVAAAGAVYHQAESSYNRTRTYFESQAATAQDLEHAKSAFLQARARLTQSEDGLKEAEAGVGRTAKLVEESKIAMEYTRIQAPQDGEVARRLAEPGDMAWPGKPLLVLQTKGALRLEARVREGLIHTITPGDSLEVVVTTLERELKGVVEEVVPSGDPTTRTFVVKVALDDSRGLLPGMFGKLRVPFEQRTVVTAPRSAVSRIGQLQVVSVRTADGWQRIYVTTGRPIGDDVEILSGLEGDEEVALREDRDA